MFCFSACLEGGQIIRRRELDTPHLAFSFLFIGTGDGKDGVETLAELGFFFYIKLALQHLFFFYFSVGLDWDGPHTLLLLNQPYFFLCFSVLHHTHTVPSQIPYAHGGVFGPFFFDTPNYGSIEDYLYQEKRKRKEVWRSGKMKWDGEEQL